MSQGHNNTDHEADPRRFLWEDGDLVMLTPCPSCVHKHLDRATCTAFPAGIPQPILDGDDDHRAPYPGDGGIQYTPQARAPRRRN